MQLILPNCPWPTDYSSPGKGVLSRLSDIRVTLYWDKEHLFAQQLGHKQTDSGQPQPNCCTCNGIHWDKVIVYRTNEHWNGDLPRADFWNGPVVHAMDFSEEVDLLLN
jgi:hypothetical protein